MLFNSYTFAVFYLTVFVLYWFLRKSYKSQNLLLLVASYIFYAWWDVRFLVLIVLSTYVDYCTSILIDRGRMKTKQVAVSSLFMVLSAFVCVSCDWTGFSLLSPEFSEVLPKTLLGWWATGASIVFVVVFVLLQKLPSILRVSQPRKYHLFWSIVINLGVLAYFKYFNFFAESFVSLWSGLFDSRPGEITLNIILPVGISFYIFQTMSHTIDVYRKKMTATGSLVELAAYVSFFPQLVAGPIERGAHLLPQFQRPRTIDSKDIQEASWLVVWGLYKKVVIADNMARIVNNVFGPYDSLSVASTPSDGLLCLVSVYAFAFQIYCDFSGYTDIARGVARLLGFDIKLNFNLPYIADSPSDFWKRWHISLSSWLKDYLYIPLGGNRLGTVRTNINLLVTMILGGLWHGAAWTFVLWGAFHGILLVVYRMFGKTNAESQTLLNKGTKRVIMFQLVCLGWLLFRAQNLTTVWLFVKAIAINMQMTDQAIDVSKQVAFYASFLVLFQSVQWYTKKLDPVSQAHWFIKLNVYTFLIVSLLRLAPFDTQEFIYFAF